MLKIKKKWLNEVKRVKNDVKNRHKFLRLDKNEKIENEKIEIRVSNLTNLKIIPHKNI